MKSTLKLSRFVHLFDIEDSLALFHSFCVDTVFLPKEFRDSLDALKQGVPITEARKMLGAKSVMILVEKHFLVDASLDEMVELRECVRKDVEGTYIHTMYLLLAEPCNLACKYCFFEDGMPVKKTGDRYMKEQTAKNALDLFCSWAEKKQPATILLYGGDPLINMKALKFAITYTDQLVGEGKLHPDSVVSIVCNGTLINQGFVDLLKNFGRRVTLGVSLDGPCHIHDRWRVDKKGGGSYDRAIAGYLLAKAAGINPSISCTLPPDSLGEIDSIVDWIIEMSPAAMSFNLMTDTSILHMDENYAEKATAAMIGAFKQLRERGIYEDRMMRKVGSFTDGKRFYKDCAGYGEQLVIAPDGQIGPCHAYAATRKHFRANVNQPGDFNPSNDATFLEWSNRSPFLMPQCRNCAALGICGGGCAANAEKRTGSIWGLDDQFCIHAKGVLVWMITDLYQNMNS